MNRPTDFNDMAKLSGLEAVKLAIDAAKPVEQKADPAGTPTGDSNKGGKGNAPPDQENATGGDPDGRYDKLEPEPLRAILPPAEPYPVEALGDVLGKAAMAIHVSVKAPLALCCQSVLAAASLAAQAHYDIKLPWGERKPLSLFLLTVGESGERKTGVDDLVLGAAKVQERADMEAYTLEQAAYETELAAWAQATDAARKAVTSGRKGTATAADVRAAVEKCGAKPVPPIAPLRFVSDPTVEGLYKLLVTGQPSVALFSDEGGLLIGGHALNSDNALKTMARWCKLWDCAPFDRVRAGDGAGVLYGRRMALYNLQNLSMLYAIEYWRLVAYIQTAAAGAMVKLESDNPEEWQPLVQQHKKREAELSSLEIAFEDICQEHGLELCMMRFMAGTQFYQVANPDLTSDADYLAGMREMFAGVMAR